jgi:site-specific DNA recombinase
MLRWAIYARYSSDRQNPKSSEDQIRECEARVAALGGIVVKRYSDDGVSGAHESQRPQYLAMLAAMKAGIFDAVMAEDLDRLNRNLEASARIYSLAERDGIQIWTLADGRISQMHTGLKGLMGEMFLKQLADKTRRGMLAVANAGRIPGGNCYGYTVSGRGTRAIDEVQAAVIRRVYSDYASNVSPIAICTALNREGVPPPRGEEWRVSTLVGNTKRLNGILANPIYVGRPVFNRQRFVKDPETGKRVARPNPPEAWIRQDVPELRIVSDELWQAVRARRADASKDYPLHQHRRPKTLLSGLVRCEECGAPMTLANSYFRCTRNGNAGTCENNRGVSSVKLEAMIIGALREALDNSEIIAEYTRHLRSTIEKMETERAKVAEAAARRRGTVQRKLDNLMIALEDGEAGPTVRSRIGQLEAELATIDAPPPRRNVVTVIPDAASRFRAQLADLEEMLKGDGTEGMKAREALRGMIGRIGARRHGNKVWIEADAKLGALLAFAKGPETWSSVGCGSPQLSLEHEFVLPICRAVA